RASLDGAGEHPGEQLGLHGNDGLGLEPESLVGLVVAGSTGTLAATAPRREAVGVGTGVQDVRTSVCALAVPDCADRSALAVSPAVMEPTPIHLLAPDSRTAVLTTFFMKSGCGCPDPPRRRTQSCIKRGVASRTEKQGQTSNCLARSSTEIVHP